jgi:hypothetical protein
VDQSAPDKDRSEELPTNAHLLSLIYDSTSDPVYLVRVEAGGQYRFISRPVAASAEEAGGAGEGSRRDPATPLPRVESDGYSPLGEPAVAVALKV